MYADPVTDPQRDLLGALVEGRVRFLVIGRQDSKIRGQTTNKAWNAAATPRLRWYFAFKPNPSYALKARISISANINPAETHR